MNPRPAQLHPYPFERLRQLFAGIAPNPDLREIKLSIGEPRHATAEFIKQAQYAGLRGFANYPTTLDAPPFTKSISTREFRIPRSRARRLPTIMLSSCRAARWPRSARVVVKKVDAQTRAETCINDLLRGD